MNDKINPEKIVQAIVKQDANFWLDLIGFTLVENGGDETLEYHLFRKLETTYFSAATDLSRRKCRHL